MTRALRYLTLVLLPLVFGCGGPEPRFTIVVIPKGVTHEHWQSVHRGADRCAADCAKEGLSVRAIFDGPLRERDAVEQIRIVDRRVATGANGIVLAPQHSQTMTACVRRAAEAGVPVVMFDSDLAEAGRPYTIKYVATNNYNGGCKAAEHLIAELRKQGKPKPKLILFRYAVGSESTEQREQGFEDTVKRICPEAVWLSTDKYAGSTIDTAMREAGPMIQQFGQQVDGIFAPNESSASGTLNVLRSVGLNKKVMLMAFDASPPLLQAIRDGDVVGSILQDPYRMGHLATWCCVRHLLGEDVMVEPDGRRERSKSTGEYVVTRENVDDDAIKGLYDADNQARRVMDLPRFPRRADAGGPP
jgi:ribose transport system substrate-binding protein